MNNSWMNHLQSSQEKGTVAFGDKNTISSFEKNLYIQITQMKACK